MNLSVFGVVRGFVYVVLVVYFGFACVLLKVFEISFFDY